MIHNDTNTPALGSVPDHARATHVSDSAPPRRSGKRCGYTGDAELHAATRQLGKVLSTLARDQSDDARRAGAAIAEVVAAFVAEAAAVGDGQTSVGRRVRADLAQQLPVMDRSLAAARARLGDRLAPLNGPEPR